jgi:hypothetical protein
LAVAFSRRAVIHGAEAGVAAATTVSQDQAKAKQIKDLRRQIYAKAVVMHKYALANPEASSLAGGQIQTLNGLIYRLLGQGDDLSAFLVPVAWINAGPIKHENLATLMEGLIIYLKEDTGVQSQ